MGFPLLFCITDFGFGVSAEISATGAAVSLHAGKTTPSRLLVRFKIGPPGSEGFSELFEMLSSFRQSAALERLDEAGGTTEFLLPPLLLG